MQADATSNRRSHSTYRTDSVQQLVNDAVRAVADELPLLEVLRESVYDSTVFRPIGQNDWAASQSIEAQRYAKLDRIQRTDDAGSPMEWSRHCGSRARTLQ